jgi:hypothetical protein
MKTRKEKVIITGGAAPSVRATVIYGNGWINRLVNRWGFGAMTIGRRIYAAVGKDSLSQRLINHECIHVAQQQQQELRWVGHWARYGWWFLRLLAAYKLGMRKRERTDVPAWREAYYNIPFEREAYANEHNLEYLKNRSKNAWRRYCQNA